MTLNLLDSLRGALGDDVMGQAAKLVGENPAAAKTATSMLMPAIVGGLIQQASTTAGASTLLETLRGSGVDSNIVSNLSGLLNGGQATSSLLAQGSTLARGIFGERVGSVSDAVSSLAGVRPTGASSLLFTLAPVVLGYLKNHVLRTGLDAGGLQRFLAAQASSVSAALDPRLARAAGLPALPPEGARPREVITAATRPPLKDEEPRRNWMPIAALAAAALLLFAFLRGRSNKVEAPGPTVDSAVAAAAAPETTATTTPTTSAAEIAPAATAGLPATVYFAAASAALQGADKEVVVNAAHAAINSGASVAITGYTDPSGDRAANTKLAKDRAKAVRAMLTAAGLSASKIIMRPPSDVTGSGSDKEARRVEITQAKP